MKAYLAKKLAFFLNSLFPPADLLTNPRYVEIFEEDLRYFIDEEALDSRAVFRIKRNAIGKCIDIYEEIDEIYLYELPDSVQEAWEAGRELTKYRKEARIHE